MTGARPTLSLAQGAKATRILGVGSTQPDRIVTNDELSQRMDTSDQWIRDRVGLRRPHPRPAAPSTAKRRVG